MKSYQKFHDEAESLGCILGSESILQGFPILDLFNNAGIQKSYGFLYKALTVAANK
jgi:hypothetical protein